MVERAPNQRFYSKTSQGDELAGTLEEDPEYKAFVQAINTEPEPLPSVETWLEEYLAEKQRFVAPCWWICDFIQPKLSYTMYAV